MVFLCIHALNLSLSRKIYPSIEEVIDFKKNIDTLRHLFLYGGLITMKKHISMGLTLAVLMTPLYSMADDDCDPDTQDCSNGDSRVIEGPKDLYPARPFSTQKINDRVHFLTENSTALMNLKEMHYKNLYHGRTASQPWGGSYWPLNQGLVANTYQDKDYKTFIFTLLKNTDWRTNYGYYQKRQKKVHPLAQSLDEKMLAKLAPSEKYDILLGDENFDLTNKLWNYTKIWGEKKKNGFLSMIDLPEGYELPKVSKSMALWEGICHGWAIASGHSPRPEKTVWVTLPNGKRMPFYPDDIKGLVTLMWGHSLIQDRVMFEGNRCNKKNPPKDKYGRYIDVVMDREDSTLMPRCADTHPGIFHAAMINILGIEGRSFVIDHQTASAIGNQPVGGYDYNYFNPMTGKEGSISNSIISVAEYGAKDPYRSARNPETTHIVGIEMNLIYINWEFPTKKTTNSPKDDHTTNMKFMYDLELNANGDIVGGQWRLTKRGLPDIFAPRPNWPDYFWVAPKNWQNDFKGISNLPEWDLTSGMMPPQEYLTAAKGAHSFIYEESAKFNGGIPHKCNVYPIGGGAKKMVDCEFRIPKPQPLINVVNKLLEESRK